MYLVAEKMKFLSNLKNYWSDLEFIDTVRMDGELMNDICEQSCTPVGKRKTQRIERKHRKLRTRIKRLARKNICFSLDTGNARLSNWVIH